MNTEETTKAACLRLPKNQAKVYEYLKQFPNQYLTPADIQHGTKMYYSAPVCAALKRLVEKGLIEKGTSRYKYVPGLGVPQGSAEHRSEAQPECGPADRQPPKPELLPQETTTQNMKTAEEVIEELFGVKAGADRYTPMDYGECIQAMKAYATAMIEADRKDCAEKARVGSKAAPGTNETGALVQIPYYFVDQDSILNRPLPPMI